MASVRKLKDKWIAEVRIKGKYKSRTFTSKAEAKDWAHAEEHKINNSTDILYGKTLGAALQRYAQEESPRKKGARWEIIRITKLLRDEIVSAQLADLRADDFDKWITRSRQTGLSDASIRRELVIISSVFTKCRKWKWLDGNPLKDVDIPKEPPPRDKTYNDEQISLILQALDYDRTQVATQRQKLAVAFLLAIETAMRQGEIWGLTWENVNLDKRTAYLADTKNGTSRAVPLSKRAVELLSSLAPKENGRVFDFSQASAGVIFRRALQLAGIGGMTFHDTRHTATTRLAKKVDMLTLAKITGHKDPRMLMVYYNPTAQDIAQMLD